MRVLILAAAAAILAVPVYAADVNGDSKDANPGVTAAPGDSSMKSVGMSNQARHANPQPAEQAPGDTTQDSKVK